MSDQPQEQPSLLTLKERVDREVAVILGRHQLVTQEGAADRVAIAELIYPIVSKAVAETPGDRAKVGITPTHLMEQFFPEVVGPSQWAEYDEDDAEFHEDVYKRVKGEVFRVLSVQPDGLVQARLGLNGGLVLCRTPKKGGREEMAYVTRHRKCIEEDNNTPAIKAAQRAMDRAAALSALAADRVPEHGKWFGNIYNSGMREGIESGKNKIKAALDVGSNDDADVGNGDDGE
jgi:hypothetical protein